MLRHLLTLLACAVPAFSAFAATTGVIVNGDGRPVAGARIDAYAQETMAARRDRWKSNAPRAPLGSGASDERGRFSLEIPKDHFVVILQIEAAGFAPQSTRAERDDDIGAVALAAAENKRGRITSGGKPVANARVVWSDRSEIVATTDTDGYYTIPDPSKWASWVTVIHPEFAPLSEPGRRAASPNIDLNRTLERGLTVSGRALSADGEWPAKGAVAVIDSYSAATSGDDGAFTIERVPSKWQWLEVRSGHLRGRRARGSDLTVRLAPAVTLRGSVRDMKTQAAVPGVEVLLLPDQRSEWRATDSALTDAKGNFTIADVAPGAYRLSASHPAFTFIPAPITAAAGDNALRTIVGTRLARASGTVMSEDGKPVAGARVGTGPASRPDFAPPSPLRGEAVSGPDGSFRVNVNPESELVIEARKKGLPGGRSSPLRLEPGERKSGVVLTIASGVAASGRVVDADGKPLADVSVTPMESQPNTGMPRNVALRMVSQQTRTEDLVRTADDGTFSMRLKEGTYDFVFRRDGFAPKVMHAVRVGTGTRPIEAALEPGKQISGRVTRGGAPVAGVRVSVYGDFADEASETAADGSFTIDDLPAGDMMLRAYKGEEFIQVSQPVKVPARDVEIKVPPGGRISGRVFDKETKEPVTAFEAGVSGSRGGGGVVFVGPSQTKPFTSDDGTFVLDGVPAGSTSLVVSASGFVTASVPNIVVEEGRAVENVEVALDRGVKVSGRVTGPDGAALSGVAVRLRPAQGRIRRMPSGGPGAVTDSEGRYTLESVEAGDQTFTFARAGYVSNEKTVTLSGREARVDAQLTTGRRISGTVVSENGGPVAGATVSAFSPSTSANSRSTRTDANGNFQLEALAEARYTFRASKEGFPPAEVRDIDISTGAPVRLVLKTGGTIYGRVMGLNAEELAQTRIQATGGGTASYAVPDAGGNYRIEGSPTGTVRLFARTGGFGGERTAPPVSVEVEAGATVQKDIEFRGDTIVRGRVTRDGLPLSRAMVSFAPRQSGASTSARTQTDSEGNYEVAGLEDGTYNVIATDMQNYASARATYEVRGSGSFDIDIRGTTIRGRVIDASTDRGIERAVVELRQSDTGGVRFPMSTVETDANGAFTLANIAAGSYHVGAEKKGYGTRVVDVDASDGPQDVEIKLSPNAGVALRVVDARDNRPLGARVRVFDQQNRIVYETPAMFGPGGLPETVEIGVDPGTYRATVWVSGYAPQNLQIQSPGTFNIAMTPGGSIVIRSRSDELRRARLMSRGQPYERGWLNPVFAVDPRPGVTQLQNIAPGVYTLEILGSNGEVVSSQQVTVTEGGSAVVEI